MVWRNNPLGVPMTRQQHPNNPFPPDLITNEQVMAALLAKGYSARQIAEFVLYRLGDGGGK
jgi:DNA-binding CsgD family transcriptional regulator